MWLIATVVTITENSAETAHIMGVVLFILISFQLAVTGHILVDNVT